MVQIVNVVQVGCPGDQGGPGDPGGQGGPGSPVGPGGPGGPDGPGGPVSPGGLGCLGGPGDQVCQCIWITWSKQSYCSQPEPLFTNFQCKIAPHWLCKFGTEYGKEQLKRSLTH